MNYNVKDKFNKTRKDKINYYKVHFVRIKQVSSNICNQQKKCHKFNKRKLNILNFQLPKVIYKI